MPFYLFCCSGIDQPAELSVLVKTSRIHVLKIIHILLRCQRLTEGLLGLNLNCFRISGTWIQS